MEAQVNVRKHARAHRVQVRRVDVNHGWHVQIDDDGDGFEHQMEDRFRATRD